MLATATGLSVALLQTHEDRVTQEANQNKNAAVSPGETPSTPRNGSGRLMNADRPALARRSDDAPRLTSVDAGA